MRPSNLVRGKQKPARWKETQHRRWKEALRRLAVHGIDPNPITFCAVIRICRKTNALLEGMLVHVLIVLTGLDADAPLAARLIQMYGSCGRCEDARGVFDRISHQDTVLWTSIIASYSNHARDEESLLLFRQMQLTGVKPNRITYLCILPVCARQDTLATAKEIHTVIASRNCELDIVLSTELINMYGKFGSLKEARRMFDRMRERNVVSWNAMISNYSQHSKGKEALHLFQQMLRERIEPSKVTFVSTLHACTNPLVLAQGRWMHAFIKTLGFQADIAVGTALINMYGRCEDLEEAYDAFYDIADRDVVTWTCMIAAHAEQGRGNEALSLFEMMVQEGIVPNEVTFVNGLNACTIQTALIHGKKIHIYLKDFRLDSQVTAGNALISMYGKCGDLEYAHKVFEKMFNKNSISWSALIGAYAHHGKAKMVLQLFQQMQAKGITPDELTFSSVLSACSFTGMVDEGRRYFRSMYHDYGIEPTVQHYNRMLDILGRAGMLDECLKLIDDMPMPADVATWMTLLGACRMHSDESRGRFAAGQVFRLDPECATAYVLLSNIYASTGNLDASEMITKIMKEKGLNVNKNDPFLKEFEESYLPFCTDTTSFHR